jgi:NAD+ kinase
MRDVVIVARNTPEALELAEWTGDYIERTRPGKTRTLLDISEYNQDLLESQAHIPVNFEPELIVSIGGDGTILYASRCWALNGSPILGVNMGRLGFLAEVEKSRFEEMLELTLENKAPVEERSCLSVSVHREGSKLTSIPFLNDAVIHKGGLARILNIRLSVDNSQGWSYRADGLIVATTTGSTAYNLSAGGPVLYPSLEAFVLTPICPFALSSRSLVLPLDSRIEIVVEQNTSAVNLTTDGQSGLSLKTDDKVTVERSPHVVKLIKNPHNRYLDNLQRKLGLFQKNR